MQNQAAVEALYSATLVEDYIDVIENLPNEMQRHLSALREIDLILYKDFLCSLSSLLDSLDEETSSGGQRQILVKIQKGLIKAKDLGDEKLAVVQALTDIIENKSRQLDHDAKNLDFNGDDEGETYAKQATPKQGGTPGGHNKAAAKRQGDDKNEKSGKRRKKQHEKLTTRDDQDDDESSPAPKSTSKSRGGPAAVTPNSGKKPVTKRKATRAARTNNADDSDKEIDLSNIEIDPDEPTYCLCDQVSYGDMIGCDNDLCPLEWFHFNCVSLTNKPKGKWYCPKCRGDKQTVMKPKAQFLKELERFNKEKEEKLMKQNG